MVNQESFEQFRERMNKKILDEAPLVVKRFWSLDSQLYNDGAITGKTKELIALACSTVARCDDCIQYHLKQCVDLGYTDDELWEAFSVGLVIGGSVVMPHLRRAVDALMEIRGDQS